MVAENADGRIGPRWSDPGRASAARVYDYVLGGEHHQAVDRRAFEVVMERMPLAREFAVENRAWVRRVVRYLVAECGVRQFLDIGSGIPAYGNVHDVAQGVDPGARVVYVDYERVPVDIGLAVLAGNPGATVLHADLRRPDSVLDDPATTALLDLTEPVAVIWAAVLHFVDDRDDPFGIVEAYKRRLPAGGYVAVSHLAGPSAPRGRTGRDAYNERVSENLTVREPGAVRRFFDGTELVEPGLVPLADWRPDDVARERRAPGRTAVVGGVGRL